MNFVLRAGKSLALVGESGSGKSTVVAILERFYNPVRGSIVSWGQLYKARVGNERSSWYKYLQTIDGYDIPLINLHHLRHNIGLVTQEPNLFDRSIKDNIAYGLDVDLPDAERMQKVIQVAKSVNLHNFVSSLPQVNQAVKKNIIIIRANYVILNIRCTNFLLHRDTTQWLEIKALNCREGKNKESLLRGLWLKILEYCY